MIKQTFTSDPLLYMTPCTQTVPQDQYEGNPFGNDYNEFLCELPRLWRETFSFLLLIFSRQEEGPGYGSVVYVWSTMTQTLYPGWGVLEWRVNGHTGEVLSVRRATALENVYGVSLAKAVMSRGGYLYLFQTLFGLGGEWERHIWQPDGSIDYVDDTVSLLPSSVDAIDDLAGIALGASRGEAYEEPSDSVMVYDMYTAEALRYVYVGGDVAHIMLEERERAYVVLKDGRLLLINYMVGEIITLTCFDRPFPDNTTRKFTYAEHNKHLLFCEVTPDNEDGSSTTVVQGYIPVPVPVRLSPPIPLDKMRVGERCRAMVKLMGEAGESFATGIILGELSNSKAVLRGNYGAPDSSGIAVFEIDCKATGEVDMDASVDIGGGA